MNIRPLSLNDYYKDYINLLSQLTHIGDISFDQFQDTFHNLKSHIFVIENNNKIIVSGTIIIEQKFIHNCSKVGHIEDIVVDKDYRKFGLGKSMIEYLVCNAKKQNCYKIILDCDKNLIQFYEKIGFKEKNIQMALYF